MKIKYVRDQFARSRLSIIVQLAVLRSRAHPMQTSDVLYLISALGWLELCFSINYLSAHRTKVSPPLSGCQLCHSISICNFILFAA